MGGRRGPGSEVDLADFREAFKEFGGFGVIRFDQEVDRVPQVAHGFDQRSGAEDVADTAGGGNQRGWPIGRGKALLE